MVMKHYFWLCIVLPLALAGCRRPQFVNHPRPDFNVDFAVFEDVGCPPGEGEYAQYSNRLCEPDSPLVALGCDEIRKNNVLGGLEPAYPIAECVVSPYLAEEPLEELDRIIEEGQFLFSRGASRPQFIRYVIFRDDQFELVETRAEFKSVFTPITTAKEALSYALVLTNELSVRYDLEYDPKYDYFVDEIEDTHVEEIAGGYLVHLFSYKYLGCGPHDTFAVDIEVTTQGEVKKVNSEATFKDPSEDDLCFEEH
jgi:hypothetical protein